VLRGRPTRRSLLRGIRAACRWAPETFRGIEIGDDVDPVGRESEVFDRHGDISTTEEIQQGVDMSGLCCGAQWNESGLLDLGIPRRKKRASFHINTKW
jgi:hypothetical protein